MDPWTQHMRRGDFAAAWQISDAALRARAGQPCWHWPRHLQYVWDGSPLTGRHVLVRCYHGLGDTVQFIRYAPRLREIAREVTVWAQPALLPLLARAPGIDRLLALHDGTPEVACEADLEIMELPHVFRTTLATLPAATPYLHVEPEPLPPRDPARPLRVGLVWRAGDWDKRRSLPTALATTLADVPGVELHVLQRGPALAEWPAGRGLSAGQDDVLAFARRLRALDLLISVDSFPAHLAGALAVPTWLLLAHDADWRWLEHREDSPWYPTLRLFRQPTPGDWSSVLAQVRHELVSLSARRIGTLTNNLELRRTRQ